MLTFFCVQSYQPMPPCKLHFYYIPLSLCHLQYLLLIANSFIPSLFAIAISGTAEFGTETSIRAASGYTKIQTLIIYQEKEQQVICES